MIWIDLEKVGDIMILARKNEVSLLIAIRSSRRVYQL